MSYFIFEGVITLNQPFNLQGEEALHLLKSRRVHIGETIQIQDLAQRRFLAQVSSISKREISLLPELEIPLPAESHFKINLYQALIKDKNLDLILQKTTELGVSSICVFQSAYSQRLKKESSKQLNRWQKICIEACKQSGRSRPPALSFYQSIRDVETRLSSSDNSRFVPTICLKTDAVSQPLNKTQSEAGEVNLIIGPEGGWHADEFKADNAIPINLGKRVLRSETAAIVAVGILQFLYGDLSCS